MAQAVNIKEQIKRAALDRGIRTNLLRPSNLLRSTSSALLQSLGIQVNRINREYPIVKPIDPNKVDVLKDPRFQASIAQCKHDTNLDIDRLANLWQFAQLSGPGIMLEVGSWHGGGALHIANAVPDREMYVFDPFSDQRSFESLDPELDASFHDNQFVDTSEAYVRRLFASAGRTGHIIAGFFPASAAGLDLRNIAFCHLDVDVYDATKKSLAFIAPRLAPRSYVLLDDYKRDARGVDQAVEEFLGAHPDFRCVPLFPGQGVIFSTRLV